MYELILTPNAIPDLQQPSSNTENQKRCTYLSKNTKNAPLKH